MRVLGDFLRHLHAVSLVPVPFHVFIRSIRRFQLFHIFDNSDHFLFVSYFFGQCPSLWVVPSLVAQTVKHLSTMQETWVGSLGWEDPLEKEMAIHSSTIAWKIPRTEDLYSPWGRKELNMTE